MIQALRQILWGPAAVYESEEEGRWMQEDFRFSTHEAAPSWALEQVHGGPCGVFAPVQAFMLARLGDKIQTPLPDDERNLLLANALSDILLLATETPSDKIWLVDAARVTPTSTECTPFEANRAELVAQVLHFLVEGKKGVLSFVYSVAVTRGIGRLQDDMDDPNGSLTSGDFGHGTQELLNLMLIGRATSNVFDGILPMGDTGLVLRGVASRPLVGYLTHLEALRYCTVGSFYKTPKSPVWVVGSTSHFTVLFSTDRSMCEESSFEALLGKVKRAFKKYDTMESGFIPMDSLVTCLRELGVDSAILDNQFQLGRLFSKMEVPGSGIVLWEDFWRVVSILLETNDLQQALDGKVKPTARKRSDSDIARELQAQFDAENSGQPPPASSAATTTNDQMTLDDEEESFKKVTLYHYNGLVDRKKNNGAPRLTQFEAVIPSRNGVGYSIPMVDTSHSGGHGCPIEDVLKTKWPGIECKWNGQTPPSLD